MAEHALIDHTGLPGVGSGGLLAKVIDTAGSNVPAPTSLTDIDATHFSVTFTPTHSKVIVVFSGIAQFSSITADVFFYWGLREGSTNIFSRVIGASHAESNDYRYISLRIYISGLTPGTPVTYKGAHKAGTATVNATVGGSSDPRSLEVWDDPT